MIARTEQRSDTRMTDSSTDAQLAATVADRLGERDFHPRSTIVQIVTALGRDQALTLLE
jgi:hypothetical protein